ncbi:MAG: hypothetical protein EBZ48_10730 [Proteobacteria bacterium]|nr:hypothetical protein [Pseudomonadota bacterium]
MSRRKSLTRLDIHGQIKSQLLLCACLGLALLTVQYGQKVGPWQFSSAAQVYLRLSLQTKDDSAKSVTMTMTSLIGCVLELLYMALMGTIRANYQILHGFTQTRRIQPIR